MGRVNTATPPASTKTTDMTVEKIGRSTKKRITRGDLRRIYWGEGEKKAPGRAEPSWERSGDESPGSPTPRARRPQHQRWPTREDERRRAFPAGNRQPAQRGRRRNRKGRAAGRRSRGGETRRRR